MSTPTGYQVTVDTLDDEAKTWQQESNALEQGQSTVAALAFNRIEAGVFQIVVDAHTQVSQVIAGRAGEGAAECERIAGLLRRTAAGYEQTEGAAAASFRLLQK